MVYVRLKSEASSGKILTNERSRNVPLQHIPTDVIGVSRPGYSKRLFTTKNIEERG
jgi:hypothetical protein